MTSKISFLPEKHIPAVQRELIRRRMWIIALTAFLEMCYYVLVTILDLSNARRMYYAYYEASEMSFREYMITSAGQMLGIGSDVFILTICIAAIAGFAVFGYVLRSQPADLYFAQPITRKRQFINSFICDIAFFGVLHLIFSLIGFGLAAGFGAASAGLFAEVMLGLLQNLILYVAIYATIAVAVLISRCTSMAVIVSLIFLAGEPLIRVLYNSLKQTYYTTYCDISWWASDAAIMSHPDPFNPINNYLSLTSTYNSNVALKIPSLTGLAKYDIVMLIYAAVLTACAFIAYRNRRAEDIGPGLVNSVIKSVLEIPVAIGFALAGAVLVDVMFESEYRLNAVSLLILIFAGVITCMFTEIICAGRLKAAFSGLWRIAVTVVVSFAILMIFKYDLTGYDSWLPATDRVSDCAFFQEYTPRETADEKGNYINSSYLYMTQMHITDIDTVKRLAAEGQRMMREDVTGEDGYPAGYTAIVSYRMKNGRYVTRRISIPEDIAPDDMNRIVGSDAYRNVVTGIDRGVVYVSSLDRPGTLSYSSGCDSALMTAGYDEFYEFAECYRADLKKYNYTLTHTTEPIGQVSFSPSNRSADYYYDGSWTFEVYDCYDQTLAFLHDHDIYVDRLPAVEDVVSAELYMTVWEDEDMPAYDCEGVFSEPDSIAEILDRVVYCYNYEWMSGYPDSANVTLTLKNERSGTDSYSVMGEPRSFSYSGFIIPADEIPAQLKDAMEKNIVYTYDMADY